MKTPKEKPVISQSTLEKLNKVDPEVCAFCFQEDGPGSDGGLVDWVECSNCAVWVHTLCDYVEDKANYVCCMCRS